MRSPNLIKTCHTPTGTEVQVYLASPHQFVLEHQQELLPDWNVPMKHLILLLQQSSISLKEFNPEVDQEKDNLRKKFLRCGCEFIFALHDQGYQSDLFDPRTGYPLFARRGMLTLDDNAVVHALLDYPLVSYKDCSLLTHPTWGNNLYPSTIATCAPQDVVELFLEKLFYRHLQD